METNKVDELLVTLDVKQLIYLGWLYSLRALPFLGDKLFSTEKSSCKQKFISDIFYALDLQANTYIYYLGAENVKPYDRNILLANVYSSNTSIINLKEETLKVSNDIKESLNTIQSPVAVLVGKVVYFSIRIVNAVYLFNENYSEELIIRQKYFDEIVELATYLLKNVREANLSYLPVGVGEFENTIISDLMNLKSHKAIEACSSNFDSQLWKDFENTLNNENCIYFVDVCKELYRSKFVFNSSSIERRLNIPKEIRDEGASAVSKYIEKLDTQESIRLNEARIILLGDKGVGKTSMARRLINPKVKMPEDSESTAGVDTSIWELREENLKVHIWDFAGHVITHAVHQFFLSERCLYILVYDGRTEKRNGLDYWLNHIVNYGGDSDIFILVNERDKHSVKISENYLKEQYKGRIKYIYRFSIKDDYELLCLFRNDIKRYIINHPSWSNQRIPLSYYNVKERLETIFAENKNKNRREHITKKEFENIANQYAISNIDGLIKDLHALGISLCYKDMEGFDMLILNPEWISHGVYKIVNWAHNHRKYMLYISDFNNIFREEYVRYPSSKYDFFFMLMKYYELAYETEEIKSLIIPQLLNEDRPSKLPEFPVGESLMLQYKVDQPLPLNTISRFIVRYNMIIKKENNNFLVWRYGVVLEDKNTIALIREEDRSISVSVKGENKILFFSQLRSTLNMIFATYKSMRPDLQYSIKMFAEISENIWLSERKILNYTKANQFKYYDDESQTYINIPDVINLYNIPVNMINRTSIVFTGDNPQVSIMNGDKVTFDDIRKEIDKISCDITNILSLISDKENREDIQIQLAAIKSQVSRNNPKINILKTALETVYNILCSLTANEIGPTIMDGIKNILKILENIF